MRKLLIFILFISTTEIGAAEQSDTPNKIVGTWFLQSIELKAESGSWAPFDQFGPNPFGVLMYDSAGNMAVQIVRRDRSIPDSENVVPAIVNGYDAYAGTYEIDDEARTITHHRMVHINPDLDDMSVVRYFQLEGGKLVLLVAPDKKVRVTWKR